MNTQKQKKLKDRRKSRNRAKLARAAVQRPRLSVFRSSQHIYAQVIDDAEGRTIAAASSLDKEFDGKSGGNVAAANSVGKLVAMRALKAGIKDVVFDRGEYIYHGRVKALAEAAREGGLNF